MRLFVALALSACSIAVDRSPPEDPMEARVDALEREVFGDGTPPAAPTAAPPPRRQLVHFQGSLDDIDLEGANAAGRALAHRDEDGEVDGYRLSGLRRGSVWEALGFRNGDILHAVNGRSLRTLNDASWVNSAAADADRLDIELTRGGERWDLTVWMQPGRSMEPRR